MLSQNHLVPLENFQSGIIIHIEVEDVDLTLAIFKIEIENMNY
ncbi:glyoxalase family protein [Streptococcus pneumoniae]|nr:glyoxalase family protein [Streptococcus pneumoniae]